MGGSPVQSDIGQIIALSTAPSCPTSPHHGECLHVCTVDAEEMVGVEIVLVWAVPNVRAGVGPCSDGNHLSANGRLGGGGAGWRVSVILQRQVVQSCFDPGLVPQRQFIDRVDSVRDGALLVLSSVVHRDRYPQLLFYKVVDVPGDAVVLWRLVKEFHTFSSCCSLFAWNLDFFPRAPCSGSDLNL